VAGSLPSGRSSQLGRDLGVFEQAHG